MEWWGWLLGHVLSSSSRAENNLEKLAEYAEDENRRAEEKNRFYDTRRETIARLARNGRFRVVQGGVLGLTVEDGKNKQDIEPTVFSWIETEQFIYVYGASGLTLIDLEKDILYRCPVEKSSSFFMRSMQCSIDAGTYGYDNRVSVLKHPGEYVRSDQEHFKRLVEAGEHNRLRAVVKLQSNLKRAMVLLKEAPDEKERSWREAELSALSEVCQRKDLFKPKF